MEIQAGMVKKMVKDQRPSWRPSADELRRILKEMKPILEAQATRADRELEQARRAG